MKINRYIASTPPGIVVTAGLLLLMQQLIQSGEPAFVDGGNLPPAFVISTVSVPPVTPPDRDTTPPERIIKPVLPPGTSTVSVAESDEMDPSGLPHFALPQHPGSRPVEIAAWTDSPLVSMVRVEPTYPPSAAANGREGYVIVQFDVRTDGAVSNAKVVESSDRVFERAALHAAGRFRYKARVVDGQPQPTPGVQTKFRFTMPGER